MRFSELCDKEVINENDCRCLGCVRDIEFDKECGEIIPWTKVIRIGPDIILVDFDEKEMKHKI